MAVQSRIPRPRTDSYKLDSRWWEPGEGNNAKKWRCLACQSPTYFNYGGARRHETSPTHRDAIEHQLRRASQVASTSTTPPPPLGASNDRVIGMLARVLEDVSTTIDDSAPYTPGTQDEYATDAHRYEFIDWETVSHELGGTIAPARTQAALSALTSKLDGWLLGGDEDDNSDSEAAEVDEDVTIPPTDDLDPLAAGSRRPRNSPMDPQWYPWPDKQTCVLDILRHLPRSLFSDHQMQIILWAMDVLGVDNRPSLFVLKTIDTMLQAMCGIGSIRHKGPLGHVYYLNDLAALLAQEMGNPRVRPHLRFYPEDPRQKLKECWQASRWLHELSPDIATPMVRVGSQDYYVYEPAKLVDGQVVVPFRWYTCATRPSGDQVLYGEGWRLAAVTFRDGTRSYIAHEYERVKFSTSSLSLSFPGLVRTFAMDDLPDPRNILGRRVSAEDVGVHPWTYTDPANGNPWRARSLKNGQSHRVVAFPMWLYCDDTSGNMSKKWNKHNSWLFTAAGLPREMAQQEANVHFLSTSNSAPPHQ